MAKKMYIGYGGKARNVKNIYIGVGGKARKVKKAYIGVGGKARLFYEAAADVSYGELISITIWTDYDAYLETREGDYQETFIPANTETTVQVNVDRDYVLGSMPGTYPDTCQFIDADGNTISWNTPTTNSSNSYIEFTVSADLSYLELFDDGGVVTVPIYLPIDGQCVVATSPANVEAYVCAYGQTTAQNTVELGVGDRYTLKFGTGSNFMPNTCLIWHTNGTQEPADISWNSTLSQYTATFTAASTISHIEITES